jgi:2-polyprenyl-3-methyl-5-hydroxy-6-metoxy-1,4-benzoquinol methylase
MAHCEPVSGADPQPSEVKPIQRLALDSPTVMPGATFEPLSHGGIRIVTGGARWSNAVGFPIALGAAASSVLVHVACGRGQVGVSVLDQDGSPLGPPEEMLTVGETRVVSFLIHLNGEQAAWLMVRNTAEGTESECDVLAGFTGSVPSVELNDREIKLALRDPFAANVSCASRAWPEDVIAVTGDRGLPLHVDRPLAPLPMPPPRVLWSGDVDAVVMETAEDLAKLLEAFQPDALERHYAQMSRDAMRSVLRMSVVRIVRLVETLARRGFESGQVLEVGAWFGSFALALRRLGYDVVACDRYSSYGDAFDSFIELMEAEGVRVVSTMRGREPEQIAGLGQFDIVLAGAVIEHIPHTPRHLLETLFGAVRRGGALALDTPNVARYWNRRALERGETIFQPVEEQYLCDPPWEGHHREYTSKELRWMLERVGCEEVDIEFFDYNMLQFEELSAQHVECLATIVEDPSQSDTLLATGRRPIG